MKKVLVVIFLLTIVIFFENRCNPNWCCVKYVTKTKNSTIQDNLISFTCNGYRGNDSTGINVKIEFITKNIYYVDSLDIKVIVNNIDTLNKEDGCNNCTPYINNIRNITSNKEEHFTTSKNYFFRFSKYGKIIKSKFIIVKIKATLTKDNKIKKYNEFFKLYPVKDCIQD